MKLKKIGVLSLGYVAAIFAFFMGILQDILTLVQINSGVASELMTVEQLAYLSGSYWWIITVPLILLVIGFLGGVIAAWIYNIVIVKLTGGLSIELK